VATTAPVSVSVVVSVMALNVDDRRHLGDYPSGRRAMTPEVSAGPRVARYRRSMAATLTSPAGAPTVGVLLREWRQRRRLSQMDLANEATVSARHLSFVETGRSKPSPELVMHLAEHLDVPLRDRNALLLAAGYAPRYAQTPLDASEMAPVRAALDAILAGHQPFPAIVVDRHWDLVTANEPALTLLTQGLPDELAPRIVNFRAWAGHLVDRLRREADATADPVLADLYDEVCAFPGVSASVGEPDTVSRLFVPLVLRRPDGDDLSFFSTVATFGTARDVTVEELSIESFFPADESTAAALGVPAARAATAG
jgi:transcriptional regulator with XRE-family HTH domain